jgi:hypothetical protein
LVLLGFGGGGDERARLEAEELRLVSTMMFVRCSWRCWSLIQTGSKAGERIIRKREKDGVNDCGRSVKEKRERQREFFCSVYVSLVFINLFFLQLMIGEIWGRL